MNLLLKILIVVFTALSVGGIAAYCMSIARQLTYVTLADGRRQERALPLPFRLLLPFCANLAHLADRPSMRRRRELAARQIVSAGFDGLLSAREFLALRVLIPLVFGLLWLLLLVFLSHFSPVLRANTIELALLGVVLLCLYPLLWLRSAVTRRHRAIQRSMPFVIDLLTLAVEAGMDFMNALQRAVERRAMDPLTEELVHTIHEIQLGAPRREALRNLARRVNMPDMRSFSHALIQADELGVSIGAILRIQSDQMRQRRFDRAERLANEAPVKMLGPLMLFIFPAVFIVLLGPLLARVVGHAI